MDWVKLDDELKVSLFERLLNIVIPKVSERGAN
jgi:hypothetical protein